LKKGYVLVEGHGEVEAAGNLVNRLGLDLGFQSPWSLPIRWKNIHLARGLEQGLEFIRAKGDAGALLFLRDEDEGCPKEKGPELAKVIAGNTPPCATAIVLLRPEYEVLFLPCLAEMAGRLLDGRPGLRPDTRWGSPSWESRRGVKEWLTQHLPGGRAYKPTLDQLPMTRMIDISRLRDAKVPCFETLERAIQFLARNFGGSGVYPPPSSLNSK
jgi:hypothetical protein